MSRVVRREILQLSTVPSSKERPVAAPRKEALPPPRCRPCAETGVVLPSSALHVSPARRTSQLRRAGSLGTPRMINPKARPCEEASIRSTRAAGNCADERQAVGAGGDDPRVEHRLHRRVRRQRRPAGDGDRSRHVRRRDSVAGQCLHALPFGVSADRGRRRRSFRPPPHIRRRHRGLRRRFTGVRTVGQHDGAHSGARDSRHRGGVADPVLAGDHRSDIR